MGPREGLGSLPNCRPAGKREATVGRLCGASETIRLSTSATPAIGDRIFVRDPFFRSDEEVPLGRL